MAKFQSVVYRHLHAQRRIQSDLACPELLQCFHALVNDRIKFYVIWWCCSNIYGFTTGDPVAVNMLNVRIGGGIWR
jgi:hypothetical protein